jgi:hypothetical protein
MAIATMVQPNVRPINIGKKRPSESLSSPLALGIPLSTVEIQGIYRSFDKELAGSTVV